MEMQEMLKRADAGDVEAMLAVADAYFIGDGLPEDDEAAEGWYQKAFAAAPDHPAVLCEKASRCMQEVALLKIVMPPQAEEKRQEALGMYERAIELGSGSACFRLGKLFIDGDPTADVEPDATRAVGYLRRGAEMGSIGCMNLLAECYERGNGVPRDMEKAIALWERTAEQENPVALREMAIRYAQGDGVPRDCAKALAYNIRAAEAGEYYGALDAARMLMLGDGVPKDFERGVTYLRKAAAMGCEEAAGLLAEMEAQQSAPTPKASPAPVQKKGCYIATAVYGSYDCPEVWTLRRFRDDRLEKSACGRLLVRVYYRISPWLVERFGHVSSLRTMCRRMLDGLIRHLNGHGFDDTPYSD